MLSGFIDAIRGGAHKNSAGLAKYRIFAIPAGMSGCAWWRFRLPLNKLKALGSALDIHIADNPNKQIRIQDLQEHIGTSDLVVLQAPGYKDALTLMKLYKSEGKKVVVDYDDYSFDLSPGNPRYAELGTKEVSQYSADGKEVFSWKDGQNGFDLKSNIAKFEAFKDCVRSADLVTTTTDYLASKFRLINPNVVICPNSIDFNLWRSLPRPDAYKDQIRIGWFGGDSHYVDLRIFAGLLPKICHKYANVKIVIQGPQVPEWVEFFKDIPPAQLEWHNWADLRYYSFFLASRHWDIGLCPLEHNEFNKCKSLIKFLEFSAVRAAVVAEDMLPYSEGIQHGSTGYLASGEEQWFDAVCHLIDNESLRRTIAARAYMFTKTHFNLDKNCRLWEEAYLKVLK